MDKKKIQALIAQRLKQLASSNAQAAAGLQTVALDQTRVGRLSRMDALQAQAMNQAGQRRRNIEKHRLEAALARINDADYGECHECGKNIGDGRLALDPAARHCIDCATALEKA